LDGIDRLHFEHGDQQFEYRPSKPGYACEQTHVKSSSSAYYLSVRWTPCNLISFVVEAIGRMKLRKLQGRRTRRWFE
jgi:hypothetical protein